MIRAHVIALLTIAALALLAGLLFTSVSKAAKLEPTVVLEEGIDPVLFDALLLSSDEVLIDQVEQIASAQWQTGYIPMLIEVFSYAIDRRGQDAAYRLLVEKTGQNFGSDVNKWHQWWWNQEPADVDGYAEFKARLYERIDPKFGSYFRDRQDTARIRLDEVRWGGVVQDGIPPLRSPKMIAAKKADYLDEDNIVFGVFLNGEAKAYPKRILAWHEMVVDEVGGTPFAGVYCTLCGAMIPYKTNHNGTHHKLGTSGFLFRSNKLMYDAETQSLWSTTKGEPVIGPLVGKGIQLEHFSVVTTTWGEWRRRHPDTKVLSLKTGHRRDYGEGIAYQDYFATDRLMFNTPFDDDRLKNKQEVLALRFQAAPDEQLAIDTAFLNDNPVYINAIGLQNFVVLTDKTGANRVYAHNGEAFVSYDGDATLTDKKGDRWVMTESDLTAPDGRRLARLPAHRAFWFGWRAAYPETKLIR